MATRPKGRREFWEAVVTRAPDHLESWNAWIKGKRGLYFLLAILTVLGIGAFNIAEWINLSWLWFLVAAVVFAFVLFHETTYEIWKDREAQGERGFGVSAVGEAYSRKVPGRIMLDTAFYDEEGQRVFVSEDDPVPRAIKILAPRETDYIRPADLPVRIRWWDRLRRFSVEIIAFIPGGVIVDSTNGHGQFKLLIYVDEPSES